MIPGSNPAEEMNVCLLCVCVCLGWLCVGVVSYECVCVCVVGYVCVCVVGYV